MTKPILTAAFGCAILLAGAIPSLAANVAGRNTPQSHTVAASSNGGGPVLCIVGANCRPPIFALRRPLDPPAIPRGCGDVADEYGLYGQHYMEFMRKCEITGEL